VKDNILKDEYYVYQQGGIPWYLRAGILLSAIVLTTVTGMLIPLTDQLVSRPEKAFEFRPVETVPWRPLPPPKPAAKPVDPKPPQRPRPQQEAPRPRLEPAPKMQPRKINLPIKLNLSIAPKMSDLAVDFTVAAKIEAQSAAPPPPVQPVQTEPDKPDPAAANVEPAFILQRRPLYPYRARSRNIEGYVDLEFTVTVAGTTADLVIIDSRPPGIFDRAARRAVERWTFIPGMHDGKPVARQKRILIRFRLDE